MNWLSKNVFTFRPSVLECVKDYIIYYQELVKGKKHQEENRIIQFRDGMNYFFFSLLIFSIRPVFLQLSPFGQLIIQEPIPALHC